MPKTTKLHIIKETLPISNMAEFCRVEGLSIKSFQGKKDREIEKGNNSFEWKGYLVEV